MNGPAVRIGAPGRRPRRGGPDAEAARATPAPGRWPVPAVAAGAWRRRFRGGLALAGLVALIPGCASTATDRQAALLAWEDRDAERGQECVRAGGRWIAGECNFRCD